MRRLIKYIGAAIGINSTKKKIVYIVFIISAYLLIFLLIKNTLQQLYKVAHPPSIFKYIS